MEEKTTFEAVIRAVRGWVDAQTGFERKRDTEGSLWATLDTEHHLVELQVHRAECAPYRYVSFQVVDVRRPLGQELVYVFHDKDGDPVEQIIEGLEQGLEGVRI